MTIYERTTDIEFTVTVRQRETERVTTDDDEPEEDPTPSFPPLRVVTVGGVCVGETTKPLAKCRQVTLPQLAKKKATG